MRDRGRKRPNVQRVGSASMTQTPSLANCASVPRTEHSWRDVPAEAALHSVVAVGAGVVAAVVCLPGVTVACGVRCRYPFGMAPESSATPRRLVAALAFATAAGALLCATADVRRSLAPHVPGLVVLPIATLAAMLGGAALLALTPWRMRSARLGARAAAWLLLLLSTGATSGGAISARTALMGFASVIALLATQPSVAGVAQDGALPRATRLTRLSAEPSAVAAVYTLLAALGAVAVSAPGTALLLALLAATLAAASVAVLHGQAWGVAAAALGSVGLAALAAFRSGGLTPSSLHPGWSPAFVAILALFPAGLAALWAAPLRPSRI